MPRCCFLVQVQVQHQTTIKMQLRTIDIQINEIGDFLHLSAKDTLNKAVDIVNIARPIINERGYKLVKYCSEPTQGALLVTFRKK